MKKHLLGLALVSTLGLAGCGGGDGPAEPKIPDGNGGLTLAEQSKPTFSPGTGNIPLPNDLIFSGTQDLTLNPPFDPASPTAPVFRALSSIDGWSTLNPFSVNFSTPAGVTINPATLQMGQTLRVYQVNALRPQVIDATGDGVADTIPPTGPVVSVVRELTPGVDYVAQLLASGVSVGIVPLRPLIPQATYMVALTNGIEDSNGNALVADLQYSIAKTELPLDPNASTGALEPVRQLVNYMENAVSSFSGIAKENIVLTMQFTTVSVPEVMETVKLVADGTIAATLASPMNPVGPRAIFNVTDTGMETDDLIGPASPGAGSVYTGSLKLPYYLRSNDPVDWNGDTVIDASEMLESATAPLFKHWLGQASGMLTYFNKLPVKTADETVPVMMTVPNFLVVPGVGVVPATKPANGWPVVVYQHGVTRNRTDMLAIADMFSAAGFAVVAIDQPLHGLSSASPLFTGYSTTDGNGAVRERTFGVDFYTQVGGSVTATTPDGTPDSSGLHYFNVASLVTTRDNFRQSAADVLFLAKILEFADIDASVGADFDSSKIYFIGESLGGIAGATTLAYDDVFDAAVLVYPGGGFAGFLKASPNIGGPINAGLAARGIVPGTALYEQFVYVAQAVGDAGDPANHAALAAANGVPTLMFQIAGDMTVPNSGAAVGHPLTGTTPLAAFMGLQTVTGDVDGEGEALRAFVRFTEGAHGDFINPAPASATVKSSMQNAALQFLLSGGTVVSVDESVVVQ